ncbi:MAG: hypothetical protein J0L53_19605 [Spirochaetes bacterium]|nr:hypothetical protein [Spirochaetota bacterium]MBX3720681.1 hypothetical protein [Turneriella sp.]
MALLEMNFALSAPARRALQSLVSPRSLEFVAERFFDKIENERYRDFAVSPGFYTTPHGNRQARSAGQRHRGEKLQSLRTRITIKTYRGMKRLQARGLGLTWQLEEILYFGFKEGFITGL